MENGSGSNPSFCRRIHQAVSTNPAFRPFRRISSHQSAPVTTDSYYPNPTAIQNKPHAPQHSKNHHSAAPKGKLAKTGTAVARNDHGGEKGKKKKPDMDDPFSEYIQRAKLKIRSLTNVGRGQSNPATDEANGGKKKEHQQKDRFGEFIQLAKQKIRTTSNVGKTSSIEKG